MKWSGKMSLLTTIKNKVNTFYEKVLNYAFNHWGKYMTDSLLLKVRYRIIFHYPLNLKKVSTFNEKLQWLKLNDRKEIYHTMADKYDARAFVKEKIGEKYLVPLLGVWEKVEDVNVNELPDEFVLKCTHDSQSIVICKDKKKLDYNKAIQMLSQGLKINYYTLGREWAYKGIKPKIVAEKLLVDESKDDLKDYKVFCFHGEPKFIQIDYDRFKGHKRRFYSTNWEKLDFKITYEDDESIIMPKPKCLQEMLEVSRKLAKDVPFLRTDWYIVENKIYFGEMTFYPGCGFEPIEPYSKDVEWGKWISVGE